MVYKVVYFTRTGTSWSSGVEVCAIPATTTVLSPGDIAVLGLNSNIASCVGGSAGDDEISFVCFQDITSGSAIEMTDNGWERINTGQWGNTEGVIQAVRTGGTIPAGTISGTLYKVKVKSSDPVKESISVGLEIVLLHFLLSSYIPS